MVADQSDIWTPTDQIEALGLGDLASMDYADLLDSLRKDLQLDAATDLLHGSVAGALQGTVAWAFVDGRVGSFAVLVSSGMEVTRTSTGRYAVTWSPAFKSAPVLVAMTNGVAGLTTASFTSNTATTAGIGIDTPSSVAQDDLFTVIAWGQSA